MNTGERGIDADKFPAQNRGMAKNYTPTPEELKPRASLFWPDELRAKEEAISVIPKLIKTQDKFISILDVSDGSPDAWIKVLGQMKDFPANLFLKHLMVLADVGGEPLKRLSPELPGIFKDGKMVFMWNGKSHAHEFKTIHSGVKIGNTNLFVDGASLATGHELDEKMEDVIMLLLFGSAITNATLRPLIGDSAALMRFVKERYIFVSRITAGATSNALGQIAQDFVRDYLQSALPRSEERRVGKECRSRWSP